jgi:hypothetical protein
MVGVDNTIGALSLPTVVLCIIGHAGALRPTLSMPGFMWKLCGQKFLHLQQLLL